MKSPTESTRVAVTGSTGHLGSVLIPMLCEQGYNLSCLYRVNKLSLESERLTWVQGDLRDDHGLDALLEGASVLIHCAGVISIGEKNQKEVSEVNVQGTEKLIASCVERKIRLIYIGSSTATVPQGEERILDENAPYVTSKEFFYGWTKACAEKSVLEAVRKEGLDAIILRPTALIGPPDAGPSRFGRTILDLYQGKLPMISTGGYDLLDIRDFAQTVINSMSLGKTGEVYLTGGRFHTLRELAEAVNPSRVPASVSIDLLLFMLPLIELYQKIVPLRWPINRESLLTVKRGPLKVISDKAEQNLGHQCRPLKDSVKDLIGWAKKEKLL